ncbi:MAG: double-strand break repair helicase AddA, partial [Hyphomicrobiales bacterium]
KSGDSATVDAVLQALAATFGASGRELDEDKILASHFGPEFDRNIARQAASHMRGGKPVDIKLAPFMEALAASQTPDQTFAAHRAVFLTSSKGGRAHAMTKVLRDTRPDLAEWTEAELVRAGDLQRQLAIAQTLAATRAAMVLGHRVVIAYEAAKRAKTLLDYDDLIHKAGQLLSQSTDAQWVLYKLDGGIDHILVDEAQDTSPEQWEIVRYLAEDMLSGLSAGGRERTLFVVGDQKQSIFSFQGASPEKFGQMRRYFAERVKAADLQWDAVPLEDSFRSTAEILAAVDAVFAAENAAAGLTDATTPVHHNAGRSEPGLVELWPAVQADETVSPDPWTVPVDTIGPGSSKLLLARDIADQIAIWLDEEVHLPARGRKIRPGDVMILVRRRNDFVGAMVRELKARKVPVAGVDRMKLTGQIAVEDLMALGRFAALPEDDLNLATVLKSPLIGLKEEDVFDIARGRKSSLWHALRHHAQTMQDQRLVAAQDALEDTLALADQVPPFEFYSRFLSAPGRREAIHKRLGIEADDPINEFLAAALDYESHETPTLDGFLTWLARGEMEIKRDMEHGKDEVRIMTVHGAKGLEANIVFLPDTCSVPGAGNRFAFDDVEIDGTSVALPVWSVAPKKSIPAIDAAKERKKSLEAEEYRRLLYVAMTRACDWLIVTGYMAKRAKAPPSGCWYDLVREGLSVHFNGNVQNIEHGRLRYELPQSGGGAPVADDPLRRIDVAITPPDWALTVVGRPSQTHRLTPSVPDTTEIDAPTAISPLAQTKENRFRRGILIHRMLEVLPSLPVADREQGLVNYLAGNAADLDLNTRSELVAEALAVIDAPGFAPFLSPQARSEVPFSANVEHQGFAPVSVVGQVDRLALIGNTLHVVDYKTHRPAAASPDEVPPATLRQMALYRAALGCIFHKETIEVSILWTNHAHLMRLPDSVLDDALEEALYAGASS